MASTTRRMALVAALGAVLFLGSPARAVTGPARAPLRMMTYNTALMNLEATLQAGLASIDISWDVNKKGYGGAPYGDRVIMISDYIKAEDPDVVVLNEVWNDQQKDEFVTELAANGDYKSYVRKIQGKAPGMFNRFADPGLNTQNMIDIFATLMGKPAGWTVDLFLDSIVCPAIPVPGFCPITDVDIHMQDSGIMLFSKHPFVEFDSSHFKRLKVTVDGVTDTPNGPKMWGVDPKKQEVAAVVYTGARGMDQLASKAAGMVRIQVTPSSIADVVFSHSNADEKSFEENADVRAFQMNQVKSMIAHALTADEMAREQVYMMGDLNTPGHNEVTGKFEEWSTLFGKNAANSPWTRNPGVFYACGDAAQCTFAVPGQKINKKGAFFTDAWGWETSTADESKTNYIDNKYFDYVLHNKPARQCMQHIRIGSEMQDVLLGAQLSDHLPVHVDFNLAAPRCTPNLEDPEGNAAEVVDLTSDHHVETYNQNREARITHPGSMQWYYLPKSGTYWINIVDNVEHVWFDVYNDYDLSDPLPPYHGKTDPRKGLKFVSHNPLYVRVYAVDANRQPDRSYVGSYSIQLWRATGATPDDSITLEPAIPTEYEWVTTTNQPTVWFDFTTNQTRAQEYADTTIIPETAVFGQWQDKSIFDSQLWVQTGPNPQQMSSYTDMNAQLKQANPPPGYKDFVNPDKNINPNQNVTGFKVEMPDLPGEPNGNGGHDPKTYYYVLTQNGDLSSPPGTPPQGAVSWITMLTDLQYFRAVGFEATDGEWLVDANEIAWLGFDFDGTSEDYCQGGGLWPSDCILIPMTSPGVVPLPLDMEELKGPFKVAAEPTAWIFPFGGVPPVQIGKDKDGGSDIVAQSIARGSVGTDGCDVVQNHVMKDKCWDMGMSSPNSPNKYSYHLYYGITHDLPNRNP